MTNEGFTFEKFAGHSFYLAVNQRLVELTRIQSGQRVVDLGAGTGAVTQLLVQEGCAHCGEVIAIEPSETAIAVAQRNLGEIKGAVARFIQGDAEMLTQLVKTPVDAVFFCNAFHLVPEKDRILQKIHDTLCDNGTFSFNTSFYMGAEPPEAELFYRRWMMKALRVLKKEYGLSPDKTRAEARHRLTEDEYVALLKSNGFKVRDKEVMQVQMPLSGFEAISQYSLFIEGILPGVSLKEGSFALVEGVRQAFVELKLDSSPRNWFLIVAEKA